MGKINGLIFIEPVTATVAPCSHGSRGLRTRTKRPTAHPHLGDGRDSQLPIADNHKHVCSQARAPRVIKTTRLETQRSQRSGRDTARQREHTRSGLQENLNVTTFLSPSLWTSFVLVSITSIKEWWVLRVRFVQTGLAPDASDRSGMVLTRRCVLRPPGHNGRDNLILASRTQWSRWSRAGFPV